MKGTAYRSNPLLNLPATRHLFVAMSIALCPILPVQAQVSIDFGSRGVSIGINVAAYPRLVRVPGYPVYYDPQANSNYFFYDGLFWVYQSDNWYASDWYNGPWEPVGPEDVPLYLLRVPVRYYRHPPSYFHGWRADAPPRWGEHWGHEWEQRRAGWDQWDRRSAPPAAPLPSYQRQYSGARYPAAPEQQAAIREQHYRYKPREAVTQEHFQQPVQRSQSMQHVQQTQPREAVHQEQPKQPPAHAQSAPQHSQGNHAENRPTQDKGHENKAAPRGEEHKDASHGKGQENKKEEHDQERQ